MNIFGGNEKESFFYIPGISVKEGKIGEPPLMVIMAMGNEEPIHHLQFVAADFVKEG